MSDLALDRLTNDLVVTAGDLSLVQGDNAIRQAVSQKLQVFSGEWFLSNTDGIPYYQSILVKNPNVDVISGLLQDAILGVNGISQLISFDFTYDNAARTLIVTFSAKTTNGTVIKFQQAIGGQV